MAHIRQMLDISGAHLDEASEEWLTANAIDTSVMLGGFGWWTPVYEFVGSGHPAVLEAIFEYARKAGCDCVLFDVDSGTLADLPTFEEAEAEGEP